MAGNRPVTFSQDKQGGFHHLQYKYLDDQELLSSLQRIQNQNGDENSFPESESVSQVLWHFAFSSGMCYDLVQRPSIFSLKLYFFHYLNLFQSKDINHYREGKISNIFIIHSYTYPNCLSRSQWQNNR